MPSESADAILPIWTNLYGDAVFFVRLRSGLVLDEETSVNSYLSEIGHRRLVTLVQLTHSRLLIRFDRKLTPHTTEYEIRTQLPDVLRLRATIHQDVVYGTNIAKAH